MSYLFKIRVVKRFPKWAWAVLKGIESVVTLHSFNNRAQRNLIINISRITKFSSILLNLTLIFSRVLY